MIRAENPLMGSESLLGPPSPGRGGPWWSRACRRARRAPTRRCRSASAAHPRPRRRRSRRATARTCLRRSSAGPDRAAHPDRRGWCSQVACGSSRSTRAGTPQADRGRRRAGRLRRPPCTAAGKLATRAKPATAVTLLHRLHRGRPTTTPTPPRIAARARGGHRRPYRSRQSTYLPAHTRARGGRTPAPWQRPMPLHDRCRSIQGSQ